VSKHPIVPPAVLVALSAVFAVAVVLAVLLPPLTEGGVLSSTLGNQGPNDTLGTSIGTVGSGETLAKGALTPTTSSLKATSYGVPVDPTVFQAGSCMLFPATAGDRHQVVFLDAGHGGIDPGAVGQTESGHTVYEADLTLPVELEAAARLRADGFTVVVSRTRASLVARLEPQDISGQLLTPQGVHDDVAARDACANAAKASVLVGIYFDAGGSTLDAGSLTAYDRARPFWPENLRLAHLVQDDVLDALNDHGWGVPDDGVLEDVTLGGPPLDEASANYGHLLLLGPGEPGYFTTPSTMPGALIEPLFITDPFEASIGASAAGQEAIASGIALAVEQYFAAGGSAASTTTRPPPATTSTGTSRPVTEPLAPQERAR
jgi:N-acetylmuramoyl-L-alanine amidase